jgi:hypothetical protein
VNDGDVPVVRMAINSFGEVCRIQFPAGRPSGPIGADRAADMVSVAYPSGSSLRSESRRQPLLSPSGTL